MAISPKLTSITQSISEAVMGIFAPNGDWGLGLQWKMKRFPSCELPIPNTESAFLSYQRVPMLWDSLPRPVDNQTYEESSDNDFQELFDARIISKKFKEKAQNLIIDALFWGEQLIFIKNEPQCFPEDTEINETIDCIVIQLGFSASWKFIAKNIDSCVLVIKIRKDSALLEPDEDYYNFAC